MTVPRPRACAARIPQRIGAAVLFAWATLALPATGVASGGAPGPAAATQRAVPATPGNLTREEKRCNASVRRVDRNKEKLAETRRAIEANRAASRSCADARACERTVHRGKTLAARERNEERQLARLEAEARTLCDAATVAAERTKAR